MLQRLLLSFGVTLQMRRLRLGQRSQIFRMDGEQVLQLRWLQDY